MERHLKTRLAVSLRTLCLRTLNLRLLCRCGFGWRVLVLLALAGPAAAVPLVSGNGHGFAVIDKESGHLSRFYAHPYAFVRPDPKDKLSEGIATTNLIADLAPRASDGATSVHYLAQSQVVQVRSAQGLATLYMPFGFAHAALIVDFKGAASHTGGGGAAGGAGGAGDAGGAGGADRAPAGWIVRWQHPVRESHHTNYAGVEAEWLRFEGTDDSLLVIALDNEGAAGASHQDEAAAGDRGSANRPDDAATGNLGRHSVWAFVVLHPGEDRAILLRDFSHWRASFDAAGLLKRELVELEQWRVPPPASARDTALRMLWRQSEVVLRMAQDREPNNSQHRGNGLIVASLPEGLWFTPWVRDMSYATRAFTRMGHRAEARAALLGWFNARPTGLMKAETGGHDYQISVVRYFGDGSEEPFFTMEGSTNVELDNWGLALWALADYVEHSGDRSLLSARTYRGTVYESARDFIVRPLLASLETVGDGAIVRADTSIWEERERDRKHFAYTSAAAITGLRGFAGIARRQHDIVLAHELDGTVERLQRGFRKAFMADGHLHGTQEAGIKNDIDGALLAVIDMGVANDAATIADVVARMERLKVVSGGYRRVHSTYTDPAIFEYWYERQEFVFVDLTLSAALDRLGRHTESQALFQRIVDDATAHDQLIPEMYVSEPCTLFPGKIGDPTGAMPMAGYGAGAMILRLLDDGAK